LSFDTPTHSSFIVQILCLVAYRSYDLGLFAITSQYTRVHWSYRHTPNIYGIFLYILRSLFTWSSRSNQIIKSTQPSCVCLYEWHKYFYELITRPFWLLFYSNILIEFCQMIFYIRFLHPGSIIQLSSFLRFSCLPWMLLMDICGIRWTVWCHDTKVSQLFLLQLSNNDLENSWSLCRLGALWFHLQPMNACLISCHIVSTIKL